MKRMLCALCILLMLAWVVPVCAESFVIAADEDDLVSMLEEALEQMECDYYEVTLNRKDKIIVVDIGMDGLTAYLLALKELGADETYEPWEEAKEAFLFLHDSILDMFATVHRDDMRLMLNVVNDDVFLRQDYSTYGYNELLTIVKGIFITDVMEE